MLCFQLALISSTDFGIPMMPYAQTSTTAAITMKRNLRLLVIRLLLFGRRALRLVDHAGHGAAGDLQFDVVRLHTHHQHIA